MRPYALATRLAPLAVVVALTSGCGDEGPTTGSDEPTTTPQTSSTSPADPSPTTSTSPSSSPTTPPSGALEKLRVVGEVVQVGDCVVLRDDNGSTWTISGARAVDLEKGARVQVTGTPDITATGCGGPLVEAATITDVG